LALAILASGCAPEPPATPRVLLDVEIPAAELATRPLRLADAEPGYRLVVIDQENADVLLTLTSDGISTPYDAPGKRVAPERGCLFTRGGRFEIGVLSRDTASDSTNRVHIRVTSIAAKRPTKPSTALAIECLEAGAGIHHEDWNRADPGAQMRAYESAAKQWTALDQPARAALAWLQAGAMAVVHLPHSDANNLHAMADEEQARAAFEKLGDCVRAGHAIRLHSVPGAEMAQRVAKGSAQSTIPAPALFAAIKHDLAEAIACYEKAGAKYFDAETWNSLGSVSYYSGDYATATTQLAESAERFRAIAEADGLSRALADAFIVRGALGQFRDAARGFDDLTAQGRSAATDAALADILDSSATTHIAVGNYDKALRELLQSSAIHEKAGDLRGLAQSLNNFATAYLSIGDSGAARDYSKRAVSVRDRLAPADRAATESEQIQSLLLAGNAERQLANLPAAIADHTKALRLAHADSLGVQARLELARDALGMEQPRDAQRLLTEAAARVRDAWGTLAPQIELELARSHAMSGELATARQLLANLKGRFEAAGQPAREIEVLQQSAAVELASGMNDAARRTNADCIARLDVLRLATVNPMFRARLVATHRAAYELEVELLLEERAHAAGRDPARQLLSRILASSDTARAGLVRENSTAATAAIADVPGGPRELAAEIALQEYQLQRAEYGDPPPATGGASPRDRLAELRSRFDASAARTSAAIAAFSPAQYSWSQLPNDTAVLSFVHSAAGLRRYLFTRNAVHELPLVGVAPLATALEVLRTGVTQPNDAKREAAALTMLSGLLLQAAPALEAKRRWIIVADATTSAVPFAALSTSAKSYRPVILDHELSLALTTRDAFELARADATARRPKLDRIAIFADPVFTPLDTRVEMTSAARDRQFVPTPRLAATADEAASIAAQLGGVDVKVFTGFDATRVNVLSPFVNAATVLHFATHATSSDAWPHGSGLMLSGVDRQGEIINGYVSTLDLLVSRRNTDLVVLSACDTARGESTQTENVAGLARAFLGSGARRVVATLWAVQDSATATLMSSFYQRLAHGASPASALREAQAAMAETGRFQRPADWAAFVLYESVRR
jgi:CHAT domain-containing protein/tetratricopeptide (TPR) repeat protein